ncbi:MULTISPECIES: thiol:disulfide interchange protein TlpA [Alphaproteobacteria]|uniref:Thiol:disulfide interchange protein TlpA n=2 Tax=Alphaproteobacteria TaxID=28211 RepID=A0A512HLJ6_9HYPH|nr:MULTISPECIES: TlpA disulfide reductase family protein [Alphaproteobacteria]GEO86325.1 thiol:disulfide interchange protein TlpA [Ciceribacter naphthalenivorans]GLR21807.1 thiol:disulfide interchange protein TlpA [Ciceribacter naphthalenivorans]GLT04663.1 thiol:disulfide interchange protein TlpA [Sphingomonas psychrolutea]
MTEKRPLGLPSAKLVAFAAVAGIVAGAAAVYVKQAGSGNGGDTADVGQCAASVEKATSLKPFTTGEVAAMVAATQPRVIGGLSFKDQGDKDLTLADFSGKTILLNLWATWCVPCREEMPALNALQKAHGNDRFQVLAINIDTGASDKPKAFLDEIGVDALGLYRDASMGVFNSMKREGLAFGLPATLLIDDKGCLLGAMNGPAAWDGKDASALIKAAVGG